MQRRRRTYPLHAVAQLSKNAAVVVMQRSVVNKELDDGVQPFLTVDGKLVDTLHEGLKPLRAEFVEDSSEASEHFLSLSTHRLTGGGKLCCLGPLHITIISLKPQKKR